MKRPFAVLLLGVLALWSPESSADDKSEAQKHFQAGVALIKAEDFAGAAAAFETSVRLYPTKTGLFNLANCHKALQRYGEALDAVSRLEREFRGKLGPDLEAEARELRETVENLVGRLSIDARPTGASIIVDGRQVGSSPLAGELLLGPGDHEVEVSLEGYGTQRRTARLESRARVSLAFALERKRSQIRVSTEVEGARVLLDGVEVGRTPLEGPLSAAPGRHRVRLEAEGHEAVEREVEVVADQQAVLFLSLRRLEAGPPARLRGPESEPVLRDEPESAAVPAASGGRGAGAWRFVGLGLTLAAGVATGVFYGLAIESHDDFEGARKDYDTVLSKLEGDGYSVELEERGIADWERMEDAREATQRFQKLGLGFGIATAALAVTTIVLFTAGGSGESAGPAVSAAPGGLAVDF